ncbi:MAG: glycosyltransferase [Candidatus Eisenbacteria bacterium]
MTAPASCTLVAFAEVAWGYFRTRKQFLLSRLAERGWAVHYLEPVAAGRGNAWQARHEGGVTIHTVPFLKPNTGQPLYNAAIELPPVRAALETLAAQAVGRVLSAAGVGAVDVAFVSNVYAAKALSRASPRLVCYDFNDHPLQFAGVPAWSRAYLDRALDRADVVLAVSAHYARELRARGTQPVVLLGNGVEFARFAQPEGSVPEAIARIARPRVGYVGKVSHFLDFAVLEHLARCGGFELVVAGPLPRETGAEVACLRLAPHAHVVGEVPYEQVPAVLSALDVALIPFRAGDPYTVGINPNKLYQYWAAGRPIVASPIADVSADGAGLSFAETPEAFERAVRAALARPGDPQAVRARAQAHDWDQLAERLDSLLRAALTAKQTQGEVTAADMAPFQEDVEDR